MSDFNIYEYIINNYYYLNDIIYGKIDENNIHQYISNDVFNIYNKIIPFQHEDVEKALIRWIQFVGFTYTFYDSSSHRINKLEHICGPYFTVKIDTDTENEISNCIPAGESLLLHSEVAARVVTLPKGASCNDNDFEFYIMISKYSRNKTYIDFSTNDKNIINNFEYIQSSAIKYINRILLKCINEELNIEEYNVDQEFIKDRDIDTYKNILNFILQNKETYNEIKEIYDKYTYNEIKDMLKS